MCTFWTLCSHDLNRIYPGKSLKTSLVSPGKPWNLVFASHGKSWKTVVYCLYKPCVWVMVQILHISQLMPLPLTVSCSSKSRLVLPFWCRLTRVVLNKIQVCVCVCVFECASLFKGDISYL